MNTKPTSIAIHCILAGAVLGGILDSGIGAILPCTPWPVPLGTNFGILIGIAAGALGFALIRAGMKIGKYADLKNQTIHRLIHKATLFIFACSIMGGVIGFTSAKRDIADRPMAQLREAYRDIDKGYVSKEEGKKFVEKAKLAIRQASDVPRERRNIRVFAASFALIGTALSSLILMLIVLQKRIAKTIKERGIPLVNKG
jgi:hypothetical protein